MIKKKFLILLAVLAALTCQAKELKRYTNLYDKLPAHGYVGYAGVEFVSPSQFGHGSTGIGITTTHGWMVRPTVFVGGGIGYLMDTDNSDKGVIPIFAEARFFFPSEFMRRIYPHISARLGGTVATEGGGGTYMQLGAGIRVPFSDNLALNVEVGPQYATKYERAHNLDNVTFNAPFRSNGMRFSFFARVSLEF